MTDARSSHLPQTVKGDKKPGVEYYAQCIGLAHCNLWLDSQLDNCVNSQLISQKATKHGKQKGRINKNMKKIKKQQNLLSQENVNDIDF